MKPTDVMPYVYVICYGNTAIQSFFILKICSPYYAIIQMNIYKYDYVIPRTLKLFTHHMATDS